MKISVLTPCYNSAAYLEKSINSVLIQNYTNWEHIIVDGNSSDNTIEVLNKFPHLKWISEPDSGQSEAMNKAFSMSTGDLIIYLNADDYFLENAFSSFIKNFKNNLSVDIVVGNLYFEKNNELFPNIKATISWKDLSILKGRFPLNPVSYMYKRKVQEKIGDFPVNEHYTMDYWFLIRAFYFFSVLKIDAFMGCFVFVENNKSSTITGEYQIQKPLAINFCLKYTPLRIFYVYFKLLNHKKNPNKYLKKGKQIYGKLKRKYLQNNK